MVVMTTISWADNNQNEQKSTSVKLILGAIQPCHRLKTFAP